MMPHNDPDLPIDWQTVSEAIRQTLAEEADAIMAIAGRDLQATHDAVEMLYRCSGRIIVTGMGKMGAIARKCSATFCSTGTPAIFLHPGEALHGDLGIVTSEDVLLVLSYSGETDEVNSLIPFMRRQNVPVIALTGNAESQLAQHAQVTLDIRIAREADPISLAPTCSTTVALAVCDALAVALMRIRGFTREQFAIYHPGGSLGRKLLLTVQDLMVSGEQLPIVNRSTSLRASIVVISQKALGAVFVVDEANRLIGIFTDGDLRRALESQENPLSCPIEQLMTADPHSINHEALAVEALRIMEEKSITVLPVLDHGRLIGAIHIHPLIHAGLA